MGSVFGEGNGTAEVVGYILSQLASLENKGSAAKIAAFLAEEGVKGACNDAGKCAAHEWIARNAWAYSDLNSFTVGSGCVIVYFKSGGRLVLDTPRELRQFVRSFDAGRYPELVKAS